MRDGCEMTDTAAFEIHEASRRGWARLSVVGELDVFTGLTFRRRLRALKAAETDVYVDLSRLEFIDCAGLHALTDVLAESRQGSWQVEVAPAMSVPARRLLGMLAAAGLPAEL
jgi:anti-anti-sigma factor